MRSYNNKFLTLSLLTIFVKTLWAANIKQDFPRAVWENNYENDSALKQVDQRISDIIAENVLHFGYNIGLKLAAADPNATRNEIYSPLSLMAALSMLTVGAKGNTYQELKKIVGLDSDSELIQNPNKYYEEFGIMLNDLQHINAKSDGLKKRPNVNWRYTKAVHPSNRKLGNDGASKKNHVIKVANGAFIQKGFTLNLDYSQVLKSIYETQVTELNFRTKGREAANEINAWVNNVTSGKISKLFDGDLDISINIILISALYFKAFWETTFIGYATMEDDFYPDGENNPPIRVIMMHNAGIFPFYADKENDCRIVGLPYTGNETTMYVIQPNNSSRKRLRELQVALNPHKINSMIDNMVRYSSMISFPKMHFRRRLPMKNILKTLNVNDIFVNGQSDLSLIGKRSQTETIENVPVSFESIYRNKPVYEDLTIFASRFGDSNNNTKSITNNYIIPTTVKPSIAEANQSSMKREKRQVPNSIIDPAKLSLLTLESNRQKIDSYVSGLYLDDIMHEVDFSVDEQGTEAAAVSSTILTKSGSDVIFRADTPFLIIIRHDPSKLPLFYGIINKPEL